MIHDAKIHWLGFFPSLKHIPSGILEKIFRNANIQSLKAGEMVFRDGDACKNYLMVLSGVVRVQKISNYGHEITLYRLRTGDICRISTTCLLAHEYYHAEAIAESSSTVVLVPKQSFEEGLNESIEFRDIVYKNVEAGVENLLELVENVAFGPLEIRLANNLIMNKNENNEVYSTHHEIASDLGSAREVISRILKRFEKSNWVQLSRGHIEILDCHALEKLSGSVDA